MGYGHPVSPTGPQPGFQPQPQLANGTPYQNRGPGSSPLMPAGIPYAFGQLPANDTKDPNRQHPIPGSYNRTSSFNPQIQSFVPGNYRMGHCLPPGGKLGSPHPLPVPGSQYSSLHVPHGGPAYGYQPPMPPSGSHFNNGPRQGAIMGNAPKLHHHQYQGPGSPHMPQPPMPHHSAPPTVQLFPPHNLPNKPIPPAMTGNLSSFGYPASLPPKPTSHTTSGF